MNENTKSERLKTLWEVAPMFVDGTPHAKFLGMKFVAVDIGQATLSLPYNDKLVGNTQTKVLHGGVLTTLLDQASGLAATSSFDPLTPVATLDLRIDYMRAGTPGKTLIAEAHAYKTTRHIAFVRAIAHEGDIDNPVASSQARLTASVVAPVPPASP